MRAAARLFTRGNLRFPIAAKFAVMLAVLVAALSAVSVAGFRSLASLHDQIETLYADHIVTLQRTTALAAESGHAGKAALEIVASNSQADIARLEEQLSTMIVPRVNADLEALKAARAKNERAERAAVEQVGQLWKRFIALRRGTALDSASSASTARHDDLLSHRIRAIFDPIEQATSQLTALETRQAATEAHQAKANYRSGRTQLIIIAILAIVVGGAVLAALVRAIVPRIREYSDFASRVAAGDANRGLAVRGSDELGDLGGALNEMVKRRVAERNHEAALAEFAEMMQLTETEDEAHGLLKRQIERLVPDTSVVTLNRNNSADRLQPTTPVADESPLQSTLTDAKPRSCLAMRFARTHTERRDEDPLIACEVCGKVGAYSICEPLLVGGEVIGSVLATRPQAFSEGQTQKVKQSVTQAAPVLANLRNLAIAELRAATDALTGLPNNRNVADTVKRMVAQASRSLSPLAALALDLDHFKQINDSYGHGSGDEVLAAVASTLTTSCRESDFVGRAGGEEFLILLPDTGLEGAKLVAEKVRMAVARVTVPSIERPITASLGVAVFPDHAGDATSLLRHADRALYVAKKNGRNRVETFTREMLPSSDAASAQAAAPADNGASAGGGASSAGDAASPAAGAEVAAGQRPDGSA